VRDRTFNYLIHCLLRKEDINTNSRAAKRAFVALSADYSGYSNDTYLLVSSSHGIALFTNANETLVNKGVRWIRKVRLALP
jgi:hypothetical protein